MMDGSCGGEVGGVVREPSSGWSGRREEVGRATRKFQGSPLRLPAVWMPMSGCARSRTAWSALWVGLGRRGRPSWGNEGKANPRRACRSDVGRKTKGVLCRLSPSARLGTQRSVERKCDAPFNDDDAGSKVEKAARASSSGRRAKLDAAEAYIGRGRRSKRKRRRRRVTAKARWGRRKGKPTTVAGSTTRDGKQKPGGR